LRGGDVLEVLHPSIDASDATQTPVVKRAELVHEVFAQRTRF
jgi:hypothetical protein